ncbi:MAG: hypothetical protein WCQ47_08380 [bacterium]
MIRILLILLISMSLRAEEPMNNYEPTYKSDSNDSMEASSVTTEFQARVSGEDLLSAYKNLKKTFTILGFDLERDVKDRDCKRTIYNIYDATNGAFQKENIVIRYRDKGKTVDACIKIKLDYSKEIIETIKKYFPNEDVEKFNKYTPNVKKEINRHYNYKGDGNNDEQIELTFRATLEKASFNKQRDEELSESEKLGILSGLLNKVAGYYYHIGAHYYSDKGPINQIIIPKMKKIVDFRGQKLVLAQKFNRYKWQKKDWNGFDAVDFEYSNDQYKIPFMEVATRVSGDVNGDKFYSMLQQQGIPLTKFKD